MGLEEIAIIAVIGILILKPSLLSNFIKSIGKMLGESKREYDKAKST